MAADDDEATPAASPRSKRSSVGIKTSELLAERVALELNVHISNAQRELIGELLQAWLEQQVDRRMKLEREEHERVKQELAETQRERNKLANLISRLP